MPGIAGIFSKGGARTGEFRDAQVASMTRVMCHEPFHEAGVHSVAALGVTLGWVCDRGSPAGVPVVRCGERNLSLVLAGEAHPCDEMTSGEDGNSAGSLHWLLSAYQKRGGAVFSSLDGVFAGVLIDERRKRTILFNDRYGMERLYWHEDEDAVYFASEAKALLEILPLLREFDREGVLELLTAGCTREDRTLFRGIETIPGASIWTFDGEACARARYFTPADWEALSSLTEGEYHEEFSAVFRRVSARCFGPGEETGISLTGGLDTRMIMACLPALEHPPVCYTFCGAQLRLRDSRIASQVADACGLRHQPLDLGQEFFEDFNELADRTVFVSDGTFGVTGAHEIYFNRKARDLSPVRVTGNFGSELLRSMSTLKPLGLAEQGFTDEFRSMRTVLEQDTNNDGNLHPITFASFTEVPRSLFGSFAAGRSQVTFRSPYLTNPIVKLAYQAPASVRQSSESAVRFVADSKPALAAIPTDLGFVRGSSNWQRRYRHLEFKLDYYCSEGLPRGLARLDRPYRSILEALRIAETHKFLRYRSWLHGGLRDYAEEASRRVAKASLPFVREEAAITMLREHQNGKANYTRELAIMFTLEAVHRLMFRSNDKAGGI